MRCKCFLNTNVNERDHARTRAASLAKMHTDAYTWQNLLELPPVKEPASTFILKCFTRKFYKSFKALPRSCYMRNKALSTWPRC